MANKESFYITTHKISEADLDVQNFRIQELYDNILGMYESPERDALIKQYEFKTQLYNDIVQYECYDVKYWRHDEVSEIRNGQKYYNRTGGRQLLKGKQPIVKIDLDDLEISEDDDIELEDEIEIEL